MEAPIGTETAPHRWLGAVVLAAGMSRRMGQPKQLLPWGSQTVIERVVETLQQAGVAEVIIVTGAAREQVEAAVENALRATGPLFRIRTVFNPEYAVSEMQSSLKAGLRELPKAVRAALVALGDQPMLERSAVEAVIRAYRADETPLVIPSYQMRRGHPWLLDRGLWDSLLELPEDLTLRDFLKTHADQITYVNVETPSILRDIDTPEDYRQQRPPV